MKYYKNTIGHVRSVVKHKLLGDLFDYDLYLLRVVSIFATFEIGVVFSS